MDVVHRSALVLDLLGRLGLVAVLVHVLGDLRAVLGHRQFLRADVRLVAHPCDAAPPEEAVLDGVLHRRAEVGVVLDLVVEGALDQLRRHATDLVVVTEAPGR